MFNFNAYSGLLLIGCSQALIFSVILFIRWRRDERLHDLFASLILIVGGLYAAQWMLGFAGWYDEQDWRSTVMFYIDWDQLVALGPLIWLYFKALTNTDFRLQRAYALHFLPTLVFCLVPASAIIYDFVIHAWVGGYDFEGFGGSRGPLMELKHTNPILGAFNSIEDVFVRIQLPIYLILTIREYRKYRVYVSNQFANGREYLMNSLRALLYIFLIGIGLAFLSEALAMIAGVNSYSDVWPRYFAISILVYAAAIQFFRLDARQTRQLRFEPKPADEVKEASIADLDHWVSKLEKRFQEQQDHLEPDLKLADLANRIGTNTSLLSKVINAHYEMNFNDLVNSMRCEKFMNRLHAGEHKQHTLLSLALDSGFNSKSTFNRAFRKQYGKSPGIVVKELDSNHDMTRPKT